MKTQTERFLVFRLAREEFALPLLEVKEVISVPRVTPLPQSNAEFLGLTDLRGTIVPVIDLRAKLGLAAEGAGPEAGVIVFESAGITLGALVDSIERVIPLSAREIAPPPESGVLDENARAHLRGIARQGDRLVLLLELATLAHATRAAAKQLSPAAA